MFRNNFYDTPLVILDNQSELDNEKEEDIEVFFYSEI